MIPMQKILQKKKAYDTNITYRIECAEKVKVNQ